MSADAQLVPADGHRAGAPDFVRLDNRQSATPDEIDRTFRALRVSMAPYLALTADDQRVLRLWVNNVVMPIAWYDARLKTLELDRDRKNTLTKGVTALAVLAMAAFYVLGIFVERARVLGLTAFQVSLLGTFALTAVEAATDASALKERYALFFKARAELRALLYDFADRWGTPDAPATPAAGALPRELREAMEAMLTKARDVVRREQDQFFDTMRFPADIVNLIFNRALPNLRARITDNPVASRATPPRNDAPSPPSPP